MDSISFNIPVQIIKEKEGFIAYTPALELCSQGDTYKEAQKMLEESVSIFFEEIIEKGTLEEVLQSCGWEKVKKEWKPPERVVISDKKESFTIPCHV